jgi:hypothetical protein
MSQTPYQLPSCGPHVSSSFTSPPSFPHLSRPPSPIFPHIGGGAPGSEAASPPLAAAPAHQSRGACSPAPSVGGATGAATTRRRSTGLTPPSLPRSSPPWIRRGPTSTSPARRSSFLSGGPRAKDDGDSVKDEKRRRRAKDDDDVVERPSSGGGGFPHRRELLPLSPWCGGSRLPPSGYDAKDATPEAPEQGRGAAAARDPAGRAVREAAASSTASPACSPRLPPSLSHGGTHRAVERPV